MTQTADPFDDVAAMFMTEGDGPGTSAPQAVVELLMVGHLPVRAGLWLAPYADAIARRDGATALVRLDGDEPMVHVMRAGPDALPVEACRNLRESILHLGPSIRTWIVRPPYRAAPAELLGSGAERVTILSSADQVAVANAYTLIKGLVEEARKNERDLPRFGLAVIGADEARATQVQRTISRTTREYLDLEVPLACCVPRIDATLQSGPLRSFAGMARPDLDEVMAWIGDARQRPSATAAPPATPSATVAPPAAPAPPATAAPPTPAPTGEPPIVDVPSAVRAVLESAPTTTSWSAPLTADPPRSAPPPVSGALKLSPKAAAEVEPKDPVEATEPVADGQPVPLAAHVPGLTPLLPRCPGHERVELAVDGDGVMHLLGREGDLRDMTFVTAWARTHRELLAMACPDQAFDPRGRTVCHVFTDDPLEVADLHGSDVHLHLLTAVEVEGRRGWYAAALNKPRRI
jgi:hypothetical protein